MYTNILVPTDERSLKLPRSLPAFDLPAKGSGHQSGGRASESCSVARDFTHARLGLREIKSARTPMKKKSTIFSGLLNEV